MTAESEGYKAGFHSLKESMHVLSEYAQERAAQHDETITFFNEAQATHATTINELRQQFSMREAQNRALVRENKKYKSSSLFLEGSIHTLSEDLINARETVAQHEVEITRFKERNLVLESRVDERDDRIAFLSESYERAASSIVSLERKLEQKTKEAADWKDLFERHPDLSVARRYQARQRDSRASDFSNMSELSLPDLLAAQDQEIDQLKVKISECHAQLAMCQCKNLMGPKAAFAAEARLESMARSERHDTYSVTD
jgi:chromosome segregation ATPase